MARCQNKVEYGKVCGAHTIEAKHFATEEVVILDFMPTSGGEFIMTDLGYCGEVTQEERNAMRSANVLYFNRHNCLARQTN